MSDQPTDPEIVIRPAAVADVPLILELIRELAEYERLLDAVTADEERLRDTLFGERPHAEVLIGEVGGEAAGFALFFHNYSTFLARPGLYLEDVYVRPAYRGRGLGFRFMSRLARIAVERGCGRFEWAVLDWNRLAIDFYLRLGAVPMDEWTVFRLTGDALTELAERAAVSDR